MTERELRVVADRIREMVHQDKGHTFDHITQAAISASDSKYVKGLVEALKEVKPLLQATKDLIIMQIADGLIKPEEADTGMKKLIETMDKIDTALQNLPEDLRK